MSDQITVSLTVNDEPRTITVEPRRTLADALREDCGLTGTRIGCAHGVCGACTIILDGTAVRGCLIFAVQAEGRAVRTVEGLAAPDGTPHPLQQAFMDHHALQCGFCTAGFLMLAAATLEADPVIDDAAILDLVSSNLCRCTGYQSILAAIRAAADVMKEMHHGARRRT